MCMCCVIHLYESTAVYVLGCVGFCFSGTHTSFNLYAMRLKEQDRLSRDTVNAIYYMRQQNCGCLTMLLLNSVHEKLG